MALFGVQLTGIQLRILNSLNRANRAAEQNLLRLSTGKKINAAKDDPGGAVRLALLEGQLTRWTQAGTNVSQASSMMSQVQLTVDQIRTQLNTIRSLLLQDADGSLSQAQRAANQAQIDQALDQINTLATTEINGRRVLDGSADFEVLGANPSQIKQVRIYAGGNSPQQFSGQVIEAAQQAELFYDAGGATIGSDLDFTVTGKLGSATITVQASENLSVADFVKRINQQSYKTGVAAQVDPNNANGVRFYSVEYGTDAFIQITPGSQPIVVTGGHGDGTANGTNAVVEINGRTITGDTRAENASLVHSTTDGTIAQSATFDLTGNLGTATISVSQGETLQTVADRINAQTANTGVVAEVAGNDLVLKSQTTGTAAQITLEVTDQGVFAVSPGSKATLVSSTPRQRAQLIYNTTDGLVADNATVTITGNSGSYQFTFTQGQTLTSAASQINQQTLATGVQATVQGNQLVLESTTFGESATVSVTVDSGSFPVSGGNGNGTANGVNAQTRVTGTDAAEGDPNVQGNTLVYAQGGVHLEIEFAAGFTGQFGPLQMQDRSLQFALSGDPRALSRLSLPSLLTSALGGPSGTLDQLRSGGGLDGLGDNTATAIRVVDEALGQLDRAEGVIDGFANSTIAAAQSIADSFVTEVQESINKLNQVNEDEENSLLALNQTLAQNASAALALLAQNRQAIVDLIKQLAGLT